MFRKLRGMKPCALPNISMPASRKTAPISNAMESIRQKNRQFLANCLADGRKASIARGAKSGDTIACPAGSVTENTPLTETRQAIMSPFFADSQAGGLRHQRLERESRDQNTIPRPHL